MMLDLYFHLEWNEPAQIMSTVKVQAGECGWWSLSFFLFFQQHKLFFILNVDIFNCLDHLLHCPFYFRFVNATEVYSLFIVVIFNIIYSISHSSTSPVFKFKFSGTIKYFFETKMCPAPFMLHTSAVFEP